MVTVTSTVPAACGGVSAVMVVASTTTTLVASAPPTVTVGPAVKFVPVIVISVPPDVGPVEGVTLSIVGVVGVAGVTVSVPVAPLAAKSVAPL